MAVKSVFDQVADMIISADDAKVGVEAWGNECCVPNPLSASSGEDLYSSYVLWARSIGAPVCTDRAFLIHLGNACIPKTIRKGKRVWLGLDVKPQYRSSGHADFNKVTTDWVDDIFDRLEDWASDNCVFRDGINSWSDDLYADFVKWNDGNKVGRVGFGQALSRFKGVYRHDRQPRVIDGNTMLRTSWEGIAIKKKAAPPQAQPAEKPQEKDFVFDDGDETGWTEEL